MNQFYIHAARCGINMTGKLAVAIEDSLGMLLMHPVINPVTLEVRIPTGIIMDMDLADVCYEIGVDYVIVLNPKHPIFRR